MLEYKLYTNKTNFHIYGLGEPLLHPQINDILDITRKYGIKTNISTNASSAPNIDKRNLMTIKKVLISMPGFSQASYDKIHGFRFEVIKRNILKLKDNLKDIPFDMTYHIYQFNLNEIEEARVFCEENDIRFAPNYAVLFEKNKCMQYVNNELSYEELKDISKDIFLNILNEQIKNSPKDYCDFRENFLNININGDVRLCNGFSKDYEKNILCGNLLKDNIDDIIKQKYNHSYCKQCMELGLTLAKGYDCKVFPNYYYSLLKENEYYRKNVPDNKLESLNKEIKFMHQIRKWEDVYYEEEELNKVIEIIESYNLSLEVVRYIILEYTRFKERTYNELKKFI